MVCPGLGVRLSLLRVPDSCRNLRADAAGSRGRATPAQGALDERRSLVLTHARYGRETGHSGVIINLANVVAVRVSKTDSAATGQYL